MRHLLLCLLVLVPISPVFGITVCWQGTPPKEAGELQALLSATAAAGDPDDAGVREILAGRSYYWPQIRRSGDTLLLLAGTPAIPGEVELMPASDVALPELRAEFRSTLCGSVALDAIRRSLEAVVDFLVERGHPFAQARVVAADIARPPAIDFSLLVIAGPVVHAGALQTRALRTRPEVFAREAGWERGVPLDAERIRRAMLGVGAVPSVTAVDSATLVSVTADTADLVLPVHEAAAVQARGIAGWVPRTGAVQAYWVGELDLELLSPFGDGRSAHAHASRRDAGSRQTALTYWEPWPLGAPFWLCLNLRQSDFDSNFIETEAVVRLRVAGGNPRWEAQGLWSKITPEEKPAAETFPARRYGVGIRVSDSSQAGMFRLDIGWTRHRLFRRGNDLPPRQQIDHSQGEFRVWRWLPVASRVAFAVAGQGGGTLTAAAFIPSNLLFRLGGVHSLRGYREEQFLVDNYLRTVAEIHFGTRRQSLSLFGEGAWLSFPSRSDRIVGAFGAGLRIAGRLELQLGIPSDGGFDQAKVHIGVSTNR